MHVMLSGPARFFISEEEKAEKEAALSDPKKAEEDEEKAEKLVNSDGTVNLPDCLCLYCHK